MFGYVSRKRNQKGFTLMEMLIVVAIIAILVAVSIPIFTSQLEKSREATDDANFRAAKAEVVAYYLDDKFTTNTNNKTYYYDAVQGTLIADNDDTITPYGKGTAVGNDKGVYDGGLIMAVFTVGGGTADDTIVLSWVKKGETTRIADTDTQTINLESMS